MSDLVERRSNKSDSRKRKISSGDEEYQMARNFNDFKKENKKRSDKSVSKKKRKELAIEEYRKNRNRIVKLTLTNCLLSPLTLSCQGSVP